MDKLTSKQIAFFDTFGYLVFPGLLADEIDWVIHEFEAVFTDKGLVHDFWQRTCVVPFIDSRERLSALLDNPKIEGIAASLLGDDFNYVGSDGNYYTGDTGWHSDGFHTVGKFIKIALYLDPVKRDTGALRVIPGSHQVHLLDAWKGRDARRSEENWGIEQRDVPAISLDSNPGDVVAFNHNLMHAAFGGSNQRRMFTLNCCRRCRTPDEIADLESYIGGHDRFLNDHMHSDQMKATASASRMVHLEQVIQHEGHLATLAAKARETMKEPARG
ncbi:MAG: phytanoyl-CoA dioxygenase family protein [Fimbriimonas sp.]|nr:phytanoyl-CoA dioxygenase family protein [Fimbriimonas sp.]